MKGCLCLGPLMSLFDLYGSSLRWDRNWNKRRELGEWPQCLIAVNSNKSVKVSLEGKKSHWAFGLCAKHLLPWVGLERTFPACAGKILILHGLPRLSITEAAVFFWSMYSSHVNMLIHVELNTLRETPEGLWILSLSF